MRVFLDTNVLASAFGTRGICTDLLAIVFTDHELIVSDPVLSELHAVLRRKFHAPDEAVMEADALIRPFLVEPQHRWTSGIRLSDPNDERIIEFAVAVGAEVLVTGDKEMLAAKVGDLPLRIMSPRQFWTEFVTGSRS